MNTNILASAIFTAVLATTLVATWSGGSPRFEGSDACAAPRSESRSLHAEAPAEIPQAEPEAPPPAPPPAAQAAPRSVRAAPRKAPAHVPAEVIIVDPGADEELPPLPPPALQLEDLFPPLPQTGSRAPCFDKLQGVGGMSPCPGSTPRGGP